jgi:PAS domain S-box-containing protein
VRPTPEELASLQDSKQEKTNQQELRESGQNARETSQDLRESDQDARESRQDAQKIDQASRETGQNTRQDNQDARESRQDARKIDLDSRQSGQNLREVGQEVLDSGQNARETSQDLRESDQDARESRQDARKLEQTSRETGQNTRQDNQDLRESGQNLREAGQEFLESGQALADIKVRYQLLVDSVTDYAIYMLDPEGRVVTWNVGAERLKGYTAEEALGRDYSVFFLPEDAETGLPAQELAAAAREGRYETQAWRQRKDGSRFWALGTLTAIRGPQGELCGFANVTRDMTAQKRLEESLSMMAADLEGRVAERTSELEATVAELQRKNREVEAFVYIVSHDLRAPLVNVQGFVRELEESCKHLRTVIQSSQNWELCWPGVQPILDEEMGGALHFISASAAKFERLINALLGFSHQGQQVYRMVQVDVRELVASATATFQQAIIEAGAKVEVGDLPSVTGDVTALGQVFSNLIGNALKYRSPVRPLKIEVGGQVKGAMVSYWVRDNGLGIPEFAKARLFRVFQRFHPLQAEGEGMGLAIAYRIVERHGGKTWAESREGAGSTFNFSLPITQHTAPIEAQEATGDESVRI